MKKFGVVVAIVSAVVGGLIVGANGSVQADEKPDSAIAQVVLGGAFGG